MTSVVYWAVLGLVIERPSYGLELYNRYQRLYADLLPVSGSSHIYTALDELESRGFIETIPEVGTGRQPKPHYRATPPGTSHFEDWYVEQMDAQRRSLELWARQLAIFAHNPVTAVDLIGRFRREYLEKAGQIGRGSGARQGPDAGRGPNAGRGPDARHGSDAGRRPDAGRGPDVPVEGSRGALIDELVAEQQRIAAGGMLSWLRFASARFEQRARSVAGDGSP